MSSSVKAGGACGRRCNKCGGQGLAVGRAQRIQQQPLMAGNALGPRRPAFQQSRPRQPEHQHGQRRAHPLQQCVQRGFIGPVQVVGHQQHRLAPLGRQRLQQLVEGGQGAITQLPGIDRHQVRAPREVQADELAQQMNRGFALACEVGFQTRTEAQAGAVGGFAVGDLQPVRQQLTQHEVGLPLRSGMCARHHARWALQRGGPHVHKLQQLIEQAAFAQPCFGQNGATAGTPFAPHGLHGRQKPRQFRFAAEQRGGQTFNTSCGPRLAGWQRALHQVSRDGCIAPLHHQRRLRLHLEQALHMAPGVVADAQRAGRRGLLHARGQIDRHAADAAVFVHATTEQHHAGVHAHAHIKTGMPKTRLYAAAFVAARFQQCQARAHGAFGIVFTRAVAAKGGQQAVASELQHAPAMFFHQRTPSLKAIMARSLLGSTGLISRW
jgi:hypothetical protein